MSYEIFDDHLFSWPLAAESAIAVALETFSDPKVP